MPTYDYRCDACGHAFEQFQSITADPIRKCPKCAKRKVKRLIGTGAGLLFKGSGFYITDYRDQGYKDKAKAESGAPADGAAKTETAKAGSSNGDAAKADKPAAAAEAKPTEPAPSKADVKPKKKHK